MEGADLPQSIKSTVKLEELTITYLPTVLTTYLPTYLPNLLIYINNKRKDLGYLGSLQDSWFHHCTPKEIGENYTQVSDSIICIYDDDVVTQVIC